MAGGHARCMQLGGVLVGERRFGWPGGWVVGTSVMRGAETAVGTDGMMKAFDGWTNKFIFPPYDFGLADCAVANFYHPESTLMMSTAAFGGYDLVYEAYKMAVKNGYMFGCYGDSLLMLPD